MIWNDLYKHLNEVFEFSYWKIFKIIHQQQQQPVWLSLCTFLTPSYQIQSAMDSVLFATRILAKIIAAFSVCPAAAIDKQPQSMLRNIYIF